MSARVLIVEDEENLRLALQDNLQDEGYQTDVADTVARAEALTTDATFDVIILDIMLPDGDGYTFCKSLRERSVDSMVLMLTARTLEDDLVRGFEAGADDYLAKPYRLRELLLRVRALAKRRNTVSEPSLRVGEFEVDFGARTVRAEQGDDPVLTKTEFDLLAFLLERRGKVLSRDEILDAVWGTDVVVDARTVDNFVSSLKKKLRWSDACGFRIQTVRGVGYRFELA